VLLNLAKKFKGHLFRNYYLWNCKKISNNAVFSKDITIIGFFSRSLGLGENARHISKNLQEDGFTIKELDYDELVKGTYEAKSHTTYLIHVNPPELPRVLSFLKPKPEDYMIGYWMWELETTPPFWQKLYPYVHEIWTASEFCAKAFRKNDIKKPVKVYTPRIVFTPKQRIKSDIFTVLYMFDFNSSMERKNPIAAIKAFKQAFGSESDKKLIIKTQNADKYQKGYNQLLKEAGENSNIEIFDAKLSSEERDNLLRSCDCLLSLHRSEGLGLTLMEAMAYNIPVVATDYSSTTEFLNETNGYPVKFKMIDVKDDTFSYHDIKAKWADADIEYASKQLTKTYEKYYGE
jgi:glycosyltransferase involved in cell wall biosynthesis